MSMPLYIEIAVVSYNESGFKEIEGIDALSKTGIAPRYVLVTLDHPMKKGITQIDRLKHESIGLWVALDDDALSKSLQVYKDMSSRPNYSRGFYDYHLPTAVVRVDGHDEFKTLTERVWEAFCATS